MKSYKDVTANKEEILAKAAKYLDVIQRRWRQLHLSTEGPKYHCLTPFIKQMREKNRIGPI